VRPGAYLSKRKKRKKKMPKKNEESSTKGSSSSPFGDEVRGGRKNAFPNSITTWGRKRTALRKEKLLIRQGKRDPVTSLLKKGGRAR